MEEYIKKSAVVAEIKRLLALYSKELEDNKEDPWGMDIPKRDILQEILSFLDILKVKEVDLEKEIKLYKMGNPIIGHREESLNNYMSNVAKYFFGLGLKVNKGE